MRRIFGVLLVVLAACVAMGASPALGATFTSQPSAASATYASATLAAPTAPRCTNIVSTSVDLAWTAPTGVTTPGLLRYSVLRRVSGTGPFTTIASGLSSTSYHDTPALGSYNYVVSAGYYSWTSPNSAQITATLAVVLSLCS